MDVDTIIQGGGLVLSGGVVVKLLDWARSAWTARNQRTEITPDPLNVREEPRFVTCDQCAEHRKAINARIDDIGPALGRVFKKLDENDKRAEERSIQTHRRLDPLVEEIGRLRGKVEIVEKAAINSTMGGKK